MSAQSENFTLNSYDFLCTIKELIFDEDLKYDAFQVQNRSEPSLHITKKLLSNGDPQPMPTFNLFIHLENGSLYVEVFTYHNKLIFQRCLPNFLHSTDHVQMVEELQKIVLGFKFNLRLCAGVPEDCSKELPASDIFIEPLMDVVVVRSRLCIYGLWGPADSPKSCSNCTNLRQDLRARSHSDTQQSCKKQMEQVALELISQNCHRCKRKFKTRSSFEKHSQVCSLRILQGGNKEPNQEDQLKALTTRCEPICKDENVEFEDAESAIFLGRCMICMRELANPASHQKHIRLHRSRITNLDDPVCCPLCGLQISNKFCLNRHLVESHPFSGACCVQCLSIIPDGSLMVSHLKNNHLEKRLLCPECGEKFRFPGDLQVHIATYHRDKVSVSSESPPVVCEQCGKEFPHRKRLVAHVRVTHNKSKQYICPTCSKVFNENYRLRKHMAVHSNLKPFKCRHCDFRTNRNDNLAQHSNKMHKETDILLPSTLDLKSDLADALLLQFNADV